MVWLPWTSPRGNLVHRKDLPDPHEAKAPAFPLSQAVPASVTWTREVVAYTHLGLATAGTERGDTKPFSATWDTATTVTVGCGILQPLPCPPFGWTLLEAC